MSVIARDIPFRPLDPEAEVWDLDQVARYLGLTHSQVVTLVGGSSWSSYRKRPPVLPVIKIPIPGRRTEYRCRASVVRAFRKACEIGTLDPLLDRLR